MDTSCRVSAERIRRGERDFQNVETAVGVGGVKPRSTARYGYPRATAPPLICHYIYIKIYEDRQFFIYLNLLFIIYCAYMLQPVNYESIQLCNECKIYVSLIDRGLCERLSYFL